jgi:hypothetical protein
MFKSKSAPKAETYFFVYRARGVEGFQESGTKEQVLEAFAQCLANGYITPTNGRRIVIAGPDYRVQPEDVNDPLLVGDAAVRAVLTEREYEAIVLGPVAEAVLTS